MLIFSRILLESEVLKIREKNNDRIRDFYFKENLINKSK